MMNEEHSDKHFLNASEPRKRPVFLVVLCILSMLYIFSTTVGVLTSLADGPLTEDQMMVEEAKFYESLAQIESTGARISDDMRSMFKVMIENTKYINNEKHYINSVVNLISLIIGAVGVMFMFNLRKIGFHFYLVYSLLPVVMMYVLVPMYLVSTVVVILSLSVATIFALLYGSQLKCMR
ncbi:MAG: hypothetical protein H3C31_00865 [Brumimicrobium sp.]|nr:hypothetical protein [Brumimicrobium sp.]MCO5268193.1 hypothetical protein [Brumimicrobium sp.]